MELLSLKVFLEAKEFLIMVKISLQKCFLFPFLPSRDIIEDGYDIAHSSQAQSLPDLKSHLVLKGKLCKLNSKTIVHFHVACLPSQCIRTSKIAAPVFCKPKTLIETACICTCTSISAVRNCLLTTKN